MIFEDALKKLKEGKKIRHSMFKKNEYLEGCYISFKFFKETPEEIKKRGMSIVKMDGEKQADVMAGKLNYVAKIKQQLKKILTKEEYDKYHNMYTEMEIGEIFDNDIFKYPQLNLLLIISDDWEVLD